jgi:cytochrome c-type biogenesis protein CcmF
MAFGGALAVTDRRYRLTSRKEREPADDRKTSGKNAPSGKKTPVAPVIARSRKA